MYLLSVGGNQKILDDMYVYYAFYFPLKFDGTFNWHIVIELIRWIFYAMIIHAAR